MRFGRLAGNDSINSRIYQCLDTIDTRDVEIFVRKFRTETDPQRFHTFQELICGAEMFQRGLKPRYERELSALTPDWTIYAESGVPTEIIDVVTLRPRYETERDIAKTVGAGRIWTGWVSTPPDRLYRKLQDKFDAYARLAERNGLAYVVALFSEFTAPVDTSEVAYVVNEFYGGLFKDHLHVSGVIHFEQSNGIYRFAALRNASATAHSASIARFLDHALNVA